jgi:hypothetical protein
MWQTPNPPPPPPPPPAISFREPIPSSKYVTWIVCLPPPSVQIGARKEEGERVRGGISEWLTSLLWGGGGIWLPGWSCWNSWLSFESEYHGQRRSENSSLWGCKSCLACTAVPTHNSVFVGWVFKPIQKLPKTYDAWRQCKCNDTHSTSRRSGIPWVSAPILKPPWCVKHNWYCSRLCIVYCISRTLVQNSTISIHRKPFARSIGRISCL